MPPCCQLLAVPAWLLALLALLLGKRAFRGGSVRSAGWSLLPHEAFEQGEASVHPWGQAPAGGGGHPISSKGLHNTGCRFLVLEAVPVAAGANAPSARRGVQQRSAGAPRVHTCRALGVPHRRARCTLVHAGGGLQTAKAESSGGRSASASYQAAPMSLGDVVEMITRSATCDSSHPLL